MLVGWLCGLLAGWLHGSGVWLCGGGLCSLWCVGGRPLPDTFSLFVESVSVFFFFANLFQCERVPAPLSRLAGGCGFKFSCIASRTCLAAPWRPTTLDVQQHFAGVLAAFSWRCVLGFPSSRAGSRHTETLFVVEEQNEAGVFVVSVRRLALQVKSLTA